MKQRKGKISSVWSMAMRRNSFLSKFGNRNWEVLHHYHFFWFGCYINLLRWFFLTTSAYWMKMRANWRRKKITNGQVTKWFCNERQCSSYLLTITWSRAIDIGIPTFRTCNFVKTYFICHAGIRLFHFMIIHSFSFIISCISNMLTRHAICTPPPTPTKKSW